ncbi:undecaprenyl-phosphate glucose phosphotransferase [bacterium]|nr:undecaprenyl-phosphate glucose phosphotransferase [bacterium]
MAKDALEAHSPLSPSTMAPDWREWLKRNIMYAGLPFVVLADWALINGVFALVYAMRFEWHVLASVEHGPPWSPYWHATILIATVWVMVLAATGLYRYQRAASKFEDLVILGFGLSLGTLLAMGLGFFYRDFSYSRLVLVYSVVFGYVALAAFHLGLRTLQEWLQAKGWGSLSTLIVGCNPLGEMMAARFKDAPHLGHRLVGFVPAPGEWMEGERWLCAVRTGELRETHVKTYGQVLGEVEDLSAVIEQHRIDEVILARPGATFSEFVELMGGVASRRHVQFRIVPDLLELMTAKIQISDLDGIPTLEIWDVPLRKWHNRFFKRLMDIALSAIGLMLAMPILLVTALLVKLTSPGPIFYKQERMGRDGRLFNIYKFRTMRIDAEDASGPVWAKAGDNRATPIGAVLRRFSLDELPQIWNVLAGDMSLVGPRPERPFFIDQFKTYIPKYMDRHLVRSGLTGWAQVNGLRGEEGTIEERTRYDIYYVENWSLLFDLRIIVKTALEVLFYKAY